MAEPLNRVPLIASAAMLFLASFGRWPYGFYQLLRFIVCGTAIYTALKASEANRPNWAWLMGGIALLFNPVIPVRFSRQEWQPIDFVVGVVIVIALVAFAPRSTKVQR